MTSEPHTDNAHGDAVELPRATIAPLVLGLGLALAALGLATSAAFIAAGAAVFAVGLGLWVSELLPGRGHAHEPLVEPALRPRPPAAAIGAVGQLRPGMPGYRFRLPEKVHPISAGVKGGIVGGVLMIVPALLWGLVVGSVWLPVNLLAGMVLPDIETMDLRQFHATLFVTAVAIHAVISVVLGLIYGVLLPTLPDIRREIAWGGLLMPVFWTGLSYPLLATVNPALAQRLDWPSFILAQIVFGVVAAAVVVRYDGTHPVLAGVLGGLVGGAVMAAPAALWALATRHGLWYPVNVLAGMALPEVGRAAAEELGRFRGDWLAAAVGVHAAVSLGFGLVYGLLLPKLPAVPGPLPWGAVVLPLLWTGASYGLMGVLNPALQEQVDWPWFVVSQFVYGAAAAVVVYRSEQIAIPPAGAGEDSLAEFATGEGGS